MNFHFKNTFCDRILSWWNQLHWELKYGQMEGVRKIGKAGLYYCCLEMSFLLAWLTLLSLTFSDSDVWNHIPWLTASLSTPSVFPFISSSLIPSFPSPLFLDPFCFSLTFLLSPSLCFLFRRDGRRRPVPSWRSCSPWLSSGLLGSGVCNVGGLFSLWWLLWGHWVFQGPLSFLESPILAWRPTHTHTGTQSSWLLNTCL